MQAGYSLKLGELVPAADAGYDDCSKFQITCPACREAVFKGLRAVPREIHYFSHYRAVDEANLCELRVAQLAKQHGIVDGFQCHEQTLRKFLANFRDNIILGYEKASGVNLRRQAMRIYVRPYLDKLSETAFQELCAILRRSTDPRGSMEGVLAMSAILTNKSQFWRRRAASYALDAMRHLDTEQAATNRRLLISMGIAAWPRRTTDFADHAGSESMNEFMSALADAKPKGVVDRLAETARYAHPSYVDEYDDGVADARQKVMEMPLDQAMRDYAKLRAELSDKRARIVALAVALEIAVPIGTLLALGYE